MGFLIQSIWHKIGKLHKMDDKNVEMKSYGVGVPDDSDQSHQHVSEETPTARGRRGGTARDEQEMAYFGKEQQLKVRHLSIL